MLLARPVLAAPVIVDGREWLQPADFVDLSWNDIRQACDPVTGACNGVLAGVDVTGYAWASVDDLNALFNHYLQGNAPPLGPGPDSLLDSCYSPWADAFFADGWRETATIPNPDGTEVLVYGWLRDASGAAATIGEFQDSRQGISGCQLAFVDLVATTATGPVDLSADNRGAWLCRGCEDIPSPVPVDSPAMLLALALALVTLACRRRPLRRTKH